MNNDIIKYNENILSKIKRFFRNLFSKKEDNPNNTGNKINHNIASTNFKESIKIEQDEETIKILELQKKYKEGIIKEEDMTEDEHNQLIQLYKKQNNELKEKINTKKYQIRKKLDNLYNA